MPCNEPEHKKLLGRYSRQICLPGIGVDGQEKIYNARVIVIGAGGLGLPAIQYLAAAGVGTIGVADNDCVDESNLQRQPVYFEKDIGSKKVSCIANYIRSQNANVSVAEHHVRVNADNVRDLIRDYDIVVDGTDNLESRYIINDACVLQGIPMVYGSVFRFEGQVSLFNCRKNRKSDGLAAEKSTQKTMTLSSIDHSCVSANPVETFGPNYRDLFPEPPPPELVPDCSNAGVFGALPGIIGSLQALEVIKWITGVGDLLNGKLLIFDGLTMVTRTIRIPDNNTRETISNVTRPQPFCDAEKGFNIMANSLSPEKLHRWLRSGKAIFLVDVRELYERDHAHIGGSHVPLNVMADEAVFSDFPDHIPVVFYCRSGIRSKQALLQYVEYIRQNDADQRPSSGVSKEKGTSAVSNCYHLEGGLLGWVEKIDDRLCIL